MSQQDLFPIDLASVDHILNTPRSVRLRLDLEREIPRETIEQALGEYQNLENT